MANFRVIAEKDAPKRSKSAGGIQKRMAEYEGYLSQVGAGKVGQLTPDPGDTVRGVALRISRAGKRAGKDVQTWIADDKVFFSVK